MVIADFDIADPGDGMAKPNKSVVIKLIGAAEVMDDLGLGAPGNRVAKIVSELKIFDNRAVLIFAGSFS